MMQAETLAYYQRIIAAGGDIDAATLGALDALITTAKRDGWWGSVVEAYPFLGTNLAAALCKVVTPEGVATSLINHGFVEADFSQEDGFGIVTGNDVSQKWLETGFVPADHGLSLSNIGFIAASTREDIALSSDYGYVIGDMVAGNAGGCGLFWRPYKEQTQLGIAAAQFYWSNECARVASFQCSGSYISTAADGVKQTGYANVSSGDLAGEIGLWKSIHSSATRYGNGKVGAVFITSYLTPDQSAAASFAVAKFERRVRSIYGTQESISWGDSIFSHQGISAQGKAAPTLAARALGLRECNIGNPGQLLTVHSYKVDASEQVASIIALPGRTVIMMFGTNDGNAGVSDTDYATYLDTVLTALKASGKKVVLCSPCYSTSGTYDATLQRQYAVKCATKALLYGCIFADTNRAIADLPAPTDGMADANHPNDLGHELMAQRIIAALHGRQERKLTLDIGSVAPGTTETQTVEVLTARVGQAVQLALPATTDAGLLFDARVTADDTVTIRCTNTTLFAIDPVSAEFGIVVLN